MPRAAHGRQRSVTTINVPYTHLFAGLRLLLPHECEALNFAFVDGSHTAAELLASGRREVLRTEPYTTAAGTAIAEKLWTIRDRQVSETDETVTLGPPLPDSG